ncbi:MAG TPA: YgiQ family radical SAM protein [Candidatus Sulfotelmatobacter sp.]|nr:YgiQ family radical SAM protein [Candidatus Sulfotelmatobacter sp.]
MQLSPQLYLPMSRADMTARGWDELDVLLVTGDAYIDHASFGAAVIGRVLEADGFRVGIISQPDWRNPESLKLLGRPKLFCGVTAGNLDSMVSNYTAARHKRREDDYTEGGVTGKRPNHAAVVYSQLCKRVFPGLPVVLGGVEASLRRVAHYDYWSDGFKPSILLDAKADVLVFGMGERSVREIAARLKDGKDLIGVRGTARLLGGKATAAMDFSKHLELPSYDALLQDKKLLVPITKIVEREQSPFNGRPMFQRHGDRCVVIEPPAFPLKSAELDALYDLPFTRRPHPAYRGTIPAFTMIKDSITVVRGCPAGCTFCGIGVHQGKFLTSRSENSVLKEIRQMTAQPDFRGTISDLGGPTANLYGCENDVEEACKVCRRPSCFHPTICTKFHIESAPAIDLMRAARGEEKVKHVHVQSGIRMDVAFRQPDYLKELIHHHVSGHLKVAPEHLHADVLKKMRKPAGLFEEFQTMFREESKAAGKEQYLVPYFISSFPGCGDKEMTAVETFLNKSKWNLQQVQDFIPLPLMPATAMYVSGLDYDTLQPITVARGAGDRYRQRQALLNPHLRKATQGARRNFPKREENPMNTVETAEEEAAPNW